MLNEEKVRYMTELAIFEKNEGKKIFPINRYFKKDYVGGQMFRSFFGYTFCYCLLLLMWVLYKLDELLNDMSIDEILRAGERWESSMWPAWRFTCLLPGLCMPSGMITHPVPRPCTLPSLSTC